MDFQGFLKALGDLPVVKADESSEALVDTWHGEKARAVNEIAPELFLGLLGNGK